MAHIPTPLGGGCAILDEVRHSVCLSFPVCKAGMAVVACLMGHAGPGCACVCEGAGLFSPGSGVNAPS